MIRKPALRLGLALSATFLAVSLQPAEANQQAAAEPPTRNVPVCKAEDGSYLDRTGKARYQRVCVWDARRLGNKRGNSFLLVQGPRGGNQTYFPISHRTAKDLTR